MHTGSLVAIAYFFRKEIGALWKNFHASWAQIGDWLKGRKSALPYSAENKIPYLLGLTLIPVALEGFTLRNIAQEVFNHNVLPLIFLAFNGIIILVTALAARGERTFKELKWYEYLLIGALQGARGPARNLTLRAGTVRRFMAPLEMARGGEFNIHPINSVVVGAVILEVKDLLLIIQQSSQMFSAFLAGSLLAGIGSWLCLMFFTSRLLERRKFALFGYYCLMTGSFTALYFSIWK